MTRKSRWCTLSLICAILVSYGGLRAAGKKASPKVDPGLAAVENVLWAEVAGPVDRREQLAVTLRENSDSPSVRWQAGFVRDGKGWRSFDEAPQNAADSKLRSEYLSQRSAAPPTRAGQLTLADWCRKQGLADEERAHLTAALLRAPAADQPAIHTRLGHCQIGNQWVTGEQVREWQETNRRATSALKGFGPKLEKIAAQLAGSRPQQALGLASLKELAGPEVIPAIEYILCGRDELSALAALEAFKTDESHQGSLALARQAVFSKWGTVRERAAALLKTRRLDDFVPGLIGLLASPVTARYSAQLIYVENRPEADSVFQIIPGLLSPCAFVLVYNYVLAQETDDQFRVAVFQTVDYRLNECLQGDYVNFNDGFLALLPGDNGQRGKGLHSPERQLLRVREVANDSRRSEADKAYQRNELVEGMNKRTEELNRRVIQVLAGVSGRAPLPDPGAWWQWWADFSDVQQLGDKPVVAVAAETQIEGDPTRTLIRTSCFAAGTPVWTDRGPVAIETITIGDRVLAQDVETGGLAYKPVLQTTVRPPRELTTLRVANETVVCTGGHRFWNSGSGWTKARDLTPQTLLRTVTGNLAVWPAKEGKSAETYNLIVADFHTYFVGKNGLLCQDLLFPAGTNNIAPGLARKTAVASKTREEIVCSLRK